MHSYSFEYNNKVITENIKSASEMISNIEWINYIWIYLSLYQIIFLVYFSLISLWVNIIITMTNIFSIILIRKYKTSLDEQREGIIKRISTIFSFKKIISILLFLEIIYISIFYEKYLLSLETDYQKYKAKQNLFFLLFRFVFSCYEYMSFSSYFNNINKMTREELLYFNSYNN